MRRRRLDRYPNFDALRRGERPDTFRINCCVRASGVAIIAPHGGKIEPWTSTIATSIAADDYCLYCFEGRKQRDNWDLHVTSTHFDEPQCLSLVARCDRVVAVHGCEGAEVIVYMGGLDQDLRDSIGDYLHAIGVVTGSHDDPDLQGLHRNNICNRGRRGMGVQLEISYGLRSALIQATPPEAVPAMAAFSEAVRAAIGAVGHEGMADAQELARR
jgi:phage replication-related protein YjqB (UPF0714/DUF867 family)